MEVCIKENDVYGKVLNKLRVFIEKMVKTYTN